MAEHNNNNGRKEVNKVGIIACVVGVILLVIIAFLVVKLIDKQDVSNLPEVQTSEDYAAGVGTIGKGNTNESEPSDSSEAEERYEYGEPLFVSMETTDWYFPSATEASTNALIAHSEMNHCDIYVEVILNTTQEVIFRSQVLKPGETLREITLGAELESGTHECVALYHLVNSDTGEEYDDNVRLGMTITIQ